MGAISLMAGFVVDELWFGEVSGKLWFILKIVLFKVFL